jgi:hypothetical protein
LRTENGKRYGDTIDHVDFAYLAKMTKLNVAALAAIASAPPPPEPKVEGAVSTDTTVTWKLPPGVARYRVYLRRTDENQWQPVPKAVPQLPYLGSKEVPNPATGQRDGPGSGVIEGTILKNIRVDDWVFGVSSVSKDGFESPVASAVPGGAFKPYIAPEKK